MMISIIVPVYNAEKYLEKCIYSIINQTYENLDIILVDDGSTDNSLQICNKFEKKDERIRVFHQENQGQNSARELGAKHAKGEFISCIDADDWIEANMYESMEKIISKYNPDIIAFGFYKEYDSGTECKQEYLADGLYKKRDIKRIVDDFQEECNQFYCLPIGIMILNKLIRKSIFIEEIQKIEKWIKKAEDGVLGAACLINARTCFVSKEFFYHYRVHKDSISHVKMDNEKEMQLWVMKYLNELFQQEQGLRPLFIQLVYYLLFNFKNEDMLVNENKKCGLFPQLKSTNKVIIFGKGALGNLLYKAIKKNSLCHIIGWMDSFDISAILQMKKEYDFILVAISVPEIVIKAEKLLLYNGVKSEKILKIQPKELLEENLPQEIRAVIGSTFEFH